VRNLAIGLVMVGAACSAPAPEVLFELEPFRLVDQTGAAFGSDELRDRAWVAGFVFTSCRSMCPDIVRASVELDRRLGERPVTIVMFSVDPVHDDPDALTAFARRHGATSKRFRFLTGDPEPVRRAVVDNFKQPMQVEEGSDALLEIAHGVRWVLVDGRGRVRGLYPARPEGVDALLRDLRRIGVS
jgi:protein SCO1/2